ncbi:hypothetical protein NIES806_26180 [Dolichospermum compactum NIES-806]|uniref:Uncharacterized protein n=1 Tax=Dolichospermum compactum NIES-806 TaxID=1973481 RepID=A0A1Z4V4F4_9CYAN|nr:hypothetical protein NIES806_26180 [Dolichospermum compactum NIES-806]
MMRSSVISKENIKFLQIVHKTLRNLQKRERIFDQSLITSPFGLQLKKKLV